MRWRPETEKPRARFEWHDSTWDGLLVSKEMHKGVRQSSLTFTCSVQLFIIGTFEIKQNESVFLHYYHKVEKQRHF